MKLDVRPVLIIFCSLFCIVMDSCFFGDRYCEDGSIMCKDSTVARFKISSEAKKWWVRDSVQSRQIVFKNQAGASLNFSRTYYSRFTSILPYGTFKTNLEGECEKDVKCNINVYYDAYRADYFETNYSFKISVNLSRMEPVNKSNLDSLNWAEHLVFKNKSNEIKLIPGVNNTNYDNQVSIPSMDINSKTYNQVIHVYDSSLMNANTIEIVGYYFTPNDGIIRYYLNNQEVWTIAQ